MNGRAFRILTSFFPQISICLRCHQWGPSGFRDGRLRLGLIDAAITVTQNDTDARRRESTDRSGYHLANLEPGAHDIEACRTAFITALRQVTPVESFS